MIVNRFKQLMLTHSARIGRNIPLEELSEEIGVSKNALSSISLGQTAGIRTETLDAFCRYFDVTIDDILVYVPDEDPEAVEADT